MTAPATLSAAELDEIERASKAVVAIEGRHEFEVGGAQPLRDMICDFLRKCAPAKALALLAMARRTAEAEAERDEAIKQRDIFAAHGACDRRDSEQLEATVTKLAGRVATLREGQAVFLEAAMTDRLGTREKFDALADRLMGRGMLALRNDDWGLLCVALEDAVKMRSVPPVDFHEALQTAKAGMAEWRSRADNRRWWRRIDGTPIPNDLMVHVAMKFVEVFGEQAPTADHAPRSDIDSPLPSNPSLVDRAICTLRRAGILPWRGR